MVAVSRLTLFIVLTVGLQFPPFFLLQWHASLSPGDDAWLNSALRKNLPREHPAQNNPDYEWTKLDYGIASASAIDRFGTDPRHWSFGKCASFSF